LDWCCMYQGPRSEEETEMFKLSLRDVNLWYASYLTIVWMLTAVPEGCTMLRYALRGWPCFEEGVAAMITVDDNLLDLGRLYETSRASWPAGTDYDSIKLQCKASRSPPKTPDDFLQELTQKTFTNASDMELVHKKYRQTFHAVMERGTALSYMNLGWGANEACLLAKTLRYCTNLRKLALHSNQIGDDGAVSISGALPVCQQLEILGLKRCGIGVRGADALALALAEIGTMKQLILSRNPLGDAGVAAIAKGIGGLRCLIPLAWYKCR